MLYFINLKKVLHFGEIHRFGFNNGPAAEIVGKKPLEIRLAVLFDVFLVVAGQIVVSSVENVLLSWRVIWFLVEQERDHFVREF